MHSRIGSTESQRRTPRTGDALPTRAARLVAMSAILCATMLAIGCAKTQTTPLRLDIPEGTVALALDVSNFNGNVTVRADHGEPGVALIEAQRFVRSPGSQRESDAAIENIQIFSEIETEGPLGVLRVETASLAEDQAQHGIDLLIRMPRCDGVRIRNAGGHVSVTDAGGTIDIINEQGSIEFRTTRRMTEPVNLITHEGEVYYQVPPDSTGTFDMLTLEGRTTIKDRGSIIEETYTARGELRFVLNDGDNPVVMRTNRGNVRAWVMDDPLALTRTFKRDTPSLRDRLHLSGTRRHTRELPYDAEHPSPHTRAGRHPAPWNRELKDLERND